MSFQDFAFAVEIALLVAIWLDGRAMRRDAAEALKLSKRSIKLQKRYLGKKQL